MEKRGWKGEALIKLVSGIPERAQRTNYANLLRAMLRAASGHRRVDASENEDDSNRVEE